MPSRAKRKRYRRKAEAIASAASNPAIDPRCETAWGWGRTAKLRRGDIRLAAHAVRAGWPTPAHCKVAITEAIGEVFTTPGASTRLVFAAVDFVLAVGESRAAAVCEFVEARAEAIQASNASESPSEHAKAPPITYSSHKEDR